MTRQFLTDEQKEDLKRINALPNDSDEEQAACRAYVAKYGEYGASSLRNV
jgi:hypothetical protein